MTKDKVFRFFKFDFVTTCQKDYLLPKKEMYNMGVPSIPSV